MRTFAAAMQMPCKAQAAEKIYIEMRSSEWVCRLRVCKRETGSGWAGGVDTFTLYFLKADVKAVRIQLASFTVLPCSVWEWVRVCSVFFTPAQLLETVHEDTWTCTGLSQV